MDYRIKKTDEGVFNIQYKSFLFWTTIEYACIWQFGCDYCPIEFKNEIEAYAYLQRLPGIINAY